MLEIVDTFAHAQQIQALKGFAWRLKASGASKHARMLEVASTAAGYANWWEALNRPRSSSMPFDRWIGRLVEAVGAEVIQSFRREELQDWHARTFPDFTPKGFTARAELSEAPTRVGAPVISYKPRKRILANQPQM